MIAGAYSQKDGRKRYTMMRRLIKSRKLPRQNREGGRTPKHERSIEAERRRGEGKNAGRKTGRPKAVNQGGEISPKNPE
ncbi:hypothetical protein TNCV_4661961 [Trichonephila clavipes]|uniref:Uncharacterized protein n=1 Tax=Trichonephila clavipes TaxID=2585209 RepID=A0A8X6VK73_TRICX|nr:hypothetical protein TNCV_4661961 [Trichonephila clavipes]